MAKQKILFACIGNCCRSQMAEGFAKKLAGNKFEIYSAGSKPAGFVSQDVVSVMKEIGIDLSAHYSKGFSDVPAEFDYVVTMGCGEDCPIVPAKERHDWKIEDPIGQGIDVFRRVRENIAEGVRKFIHEHA
ncbi:MAG: arsenate reductase ArsC [Candidatus Margulisbacteria bacterium]|nr:arsenate reductase ArsC [Candidatus Margulisiibacteriota bacterium]